MTPVHDPAQEERPRSGAGEPVVQRISRCCWFPRAEIRRLQIGAVTGESCVSLKCQIPGPWSMRWASLPRGPDGFVVPTTRSSSGGAGQVGPGLSASPTRCRDVQGKAGVPQRR